MLLSLCAFLPGASALKVTLYEESLCPSCRSYIQDVLAHLFANNMLDNVDLNIVAVGNARKDHEGNIKCQHGPKECLGNRIINCAIDLHPQMDVWFPFIFCLERHANHEPYFHRRTKICARKHGVDGQAILNCAHGPLGKELVEKAYNETAALVPAHTYVPWVVVDGLPLYAGDIYLQAIICVFIPESERPEACYKNPHPNSLASEMGRTQQSVAPLKTVAT